MKPEREEVKEEQQAKLWTSWRTRPSRTNTAIYKAYQYHQAWLGMLSAQPRCCTSYDVIFAPHSAWKSSHRSLTVSKLALVTIYEMPVFESAWDVLIQSPHDPSQSVVSLGVAHRWFTRQPSNDWSCSFDNRACAFFYVGNWGGMADLQRSVMNAFKQATWCCMPSLVEWPFDSVFFPHESKACLQ